MRHSSQLWPLVMLLLCCRPSSLSEPQQGAALPQCTGAEVKRVVKFGASKDGLWGNHVTSVLVDSKGTLWVATFPGVLQAFDKAGWHTANNELLACMNSQRSLSRRSTVKALEGIAKAAGAPGTGIAPKDQCRIGDIAEDGSGRIIVSVNSTVCRRDPLGWTEIPIPYKITRGDPTAVEVLSEDRIVIGTDRGGVAVFDGQKWDLIFPEPEPDRWRENVDCVYVSALATDGKERIWFAPTRGEPVLEYTEGKWQPYSDEPWRGSDEPRFLQLGLYWDAYRGRLLIGLYGASGEGRSSGRLLEFDGQARVTYRPAFKSAWYQPRHSMRAIYADATGSVWLGLHLRWGLACVCGDVYKLFPLGESRPDVTGITGDGSGNVWVGTDRGLFLLEREVDQQELTRRRVARKAQDQVKNEK